MKAVISTTHDDKYLFFLPIITYCWKKLGVDVICFLPYLNGEIQNKQIDCVNDALRAANLKVQYAGFDAPEHKQATYAQCSRLYAACLDLPEDEMLITSDVDMAVLNLSEPMRVVFGNFISVVGYDLVPDKQVPMCYLAGSVRAWRTTFGLGSSYQKELDKLLGGIECDSFRGNYWAKDQEEAYVNIRGVRGRSACWRRAKEGTQFATNRYDRDDAFLLDRLSPDTIDYHLPRPGYEENNFNQMLTVLKYHYPNDNFNWLVEYRNQYNKLL
jgi:hypothetical protein